MTMRARCIATAVVGLTMTLTACGQKGPLYLPDSSGEVVTRPTQTAPNDTTAPTPNGGVSGKKPDSESTPPR